MPDQGRNSVAIPSPTRAGGFGDRADLAAGYAARTGLDLSGLDRYRALTHWTAATLLTLMIEPPSRSAMRAPNSEK